MITMSPFPPAENVRSTGVVRAASGRLTVNDVRFADVLAEVLTGGPSADPLKPISEAAIMDLERQALLELIRTPATLRRIDHMLVTGKPLRN